MNAPRRGWSNATLATVREWRAGAVGSGQVFDAIANEKRLPEPMRATFVQAHRGNVALCELAASMVDCRDEAVFGDVAETQPAPSNDPRRAPTDPAPPSVPSIWEIERIASECPGTFDIACDRVDARTVRIRLRGADNEARQAIADRVTALLGIACSVEERSDAP